MHHRCISFGCLHFHLTDTCIHMYYVKRNLCLYELPNITITHVMPKVELRSRSSGASRILSMHAWMLSFFFSVPWRYVLAAFIFRRAKKLLSHTCKECSPSEAETDMGIGDVDFPPLNNACSSLTQEKTILCSNT